MNDPYIDRSVLLTGAGGSIGSALANAIVEHRPRSLILLDHSECNLHQVEFALSALPGSEAHVSILGDICDAALLSEIFDEHAPEAVIHAAAFKHVPLMEFNPIAAVQNNALATNLLAQTAAMHGVSTFVMVSTDKAVNPHSVMGASKRLAELRCCDGVPRAARCGPFGWEMFSRLTAAWFRNSSSKSRLADL